MTNLTRYDAHGIELVIDTVTGEAFATQSGYARMSGKTRQAINKRLQGCNQNELKQAEILTDSGLQGCNLIPAQLVFKWLIKDNPGLAEAMGSVGATVYLHQLAGFKVTSDALADLPKTPQLPPADVRVSLLRDALTAFGVDLDNPRYSQALQDIALDILGVSQPTLTPSEGAWVGVVERAEQLGYPSVTVAAVRSQLGKYVKGRGLESKQENRLCYGTQRPVWVYRITPELDRVIHQFWE